MNYILLSKISYFISNQITEPPEKKYKERMLDGLANVSFPYIQIFYNYIDRLIKMNDPVVKEENRYNKRVSYKEFKANEK